MEEPEPTPGVPEEAAVDPAERGIGSKAALLATVLKEAPPRSLIQDEEPRDDRGDRIGEDRFGTGDVAKQLARVLEKVDPPYTISLSGPWGVGKTWVTQRLRPLLREAHVPVVHVDLWTQDIQDLRRVLAVEAAVGLSGSMGIPSRERAARKKSARKLDLAIRQPEATPIKPAFSFAGVLQDWKQSALVLALTILGLVLIYLGLSQPQLSSGGLAPLPSVLVLGGTTLLAWLLLHSGLVLSVSAPTGTLAPIRESLALRTMFERSVTSGRERKVLIVLDNLDRLTGEDAVAALGEIRSFVDVPKSRCLFLIPLDRGALERHLVREMGGDRQSARDYLDKFFNLDLLLTKPVPADLRDAITGLLIELFPDADLETLKVTAEIIAEAAGGSPRAAKRIANGIYARSYLLPTDSRERITLWDMAFVESLISRFPEVIDRLAEDPQEWMRRVTEVRDESHPAQALDNLRWLLDRKGAALGDVDDDAARGERSQQDSGDGLSWEEREWGATRSLARFLLFTTLTAATDPGEVRTILSVRPNRQMARIPNQGMVTLALAAGNGDQLREALEGLAGPQLRDAVAALVDEARASIDRGYPVSIINYLNAVLPVADLAAHQGDILRHATASYVVSVDPDQLRSFSRAAIEALFGGGLKRLPHGPDLADKIISGLAANIQPPATMLVWGLVYIQRDLTAQQIETAEANLPQLSDPELAPLFDKGATDYRLIGGKVAEVYADRVTKWDPAADQGPVKLAAECLKVSVEKTEWNGTAALDLIFSKANELLNADTLTDTSVPVIEAVVALSVTQQPRPILDELATRIAAWQVLEAQHGIELALLIPVTTPDAVAPALTNRMTTLDADAFKNVVTAHRTALEQHGVKVAGLATARWVNGQGSDYVAVALGDGEDGNITTVLAGLQGVADAATYPFLVEALAQHALRLGSQPLAEGLISDLAKRISTFGPPAIGSMAASLALVQELGSPEPVMTAMHAAIIAADKSDIDPLTDVVRQLVASGVTGSRGLPPEIANRGAAHGTVSLGNLRWLSEQPDTDPETTRSGFLGAIEIAPYDQVHAALEGMDGRVRRAWQIGLALVRRAAAEPVGGRLGWLDDAASSGVPSQRDHSTEREEYGQALDRALEGDDSVQDAVVRLRQKLQT